MPASIGSQDNESSTIRNHEAQSAAETRTAASQKDENKTNWGKWLEVAYHIILAFAGTLFLCKLMFLSTIKLLR